MKMKFRACAALATWLVLGIAQAQPVVEEGAAAASASAPAKRPSKVGAVCTRIGKPDIPDVKWGGRAAYHAIVAVKDGRVVSAEFRSLVSGVPREVDRSLKNAIMEAFRTHYECPGDHVFEQQFSFSFG